MKKKLMMIFILLITRTAFAHPVIALGMHYDQGIEGVVLSPVNKNSWQRMAAYPWVMKAAIWKDNQFYSVGEDCSIATSLDGIHWILQKKICHDTLNAVSWGNNRFVAVGDRGVILVSVDGTHWTRENSPTHHTLQSILWAHQQFVAVGQEGMIATSPDGFHWRITFDYPGSSLMDIAWNNKQWVVVGTLSYDEKRSLILTSLDGITWTPQTELAVNLNSIAWGNERYVAVGNNGVIITSPDGSHWQLQPVESKIAFRTIKRIHHYFVAGGYVNDQQTPLFTSDDGIHWMANDVSDNYLGIETIA